MNKMISVIFAMLRYVLEALFLLGSTLFLLQRALVNLIWLVKKQIERVYKLFLLTLSRVYLTSTAVCLRLVKLAAQQKKRWRAARAAIAVAVGLIAGLAVDYYAFEYIRSLPNPTSLDDFNTPAATLIYDVNGVLLYSAYSDTYRVPVELFDIPPTLIAATIQAEDARFFSHSGVDLHGIARAVINNVQQKPTQGASTITQQLARTVFLDRNRTLKRKVDEIILALKIEQQFSKAEILELYFNTIPYGGVTVGVEAAANHYFHKSARELSAAEAVFLVTITPAPSVYLQTAQENPADQQRITALAEQMRNSGAITEETYAEIATTQLKFSPRVTYKRAPHAVDMVLEQIHSKLVPAAARESGVVVHTSIDVELQNQVQEIVLSEVATQGEQYHFSNAAVLIADPTTGAISAMVGSTNYYEPLFGQVNVVTAQRQLGSTLKIVPYALALEGAWKPDTDILDAPVVFPAYQNYQPRNYDNKFHGMVTLTEALGNSYNIPALKLANELGVDNVATLGVKMGIVEFSQFSDAIPLSLAIGGVETSLFNLAQAYQVVAHAGEKLPLHLITRITTHGGKVLHQQQPDPARVLSTQTANELRTILSDQAARAVMFGSSEFFTFDSESVAIKTGTSNNFKDNVAIAFADNFVVAAWVGNNSGMSMSRVTSGQTGATPIMHSTTQLVLEMNRSRTVLSSK
ncbi:MAG: hypothetical protein A3A82_02320 [Candidatus Pacebacteria bacterium RIFCSPLOWO2_01_FULL_47_12]|nr:MAG: hypothetical protein A3A82_02320 [Candidatus Pacebacteria bacterium RIFCSPLOWO2_01_FULL_47_12]